MGKDKSAHFQNDLVRVVNAHSNILLRGFFGRFRWLLFGR